MPACNAASLTALAQQLRTAAAAQDWLRLAQLDQLLGQWIKASPTTAAATAHEEWRAAWLLVQDAHTQAWTACQQAKAEAGAQLQRLQQTQEAQQAYAWQEVLK